MRDFPPDINQELSCRFLDNLNAGDPVVAQLVGDYAYWGPKSEERLIWFDFVDVPAGIEAETIFAAVDVLESVARRCLGPDWRVTVTFGAPA